MISHLRRVLVGAFLLVSLWGGLSLPVHAQTVVDPGLQEIGEVTQLTATDPRVIAARIINIALGTLGIILLCIVLYAGFLWMTAGGDPKQVQRAKDMLRNAVIGVVIILCSWAIVTFILNRLLGATGGDGGNGSNGGGPGHRATLPQHTAGIGEMKTPVWVRRDVVLAFHESLFA